MYSGSPNDLEKYRDTKLQDLISKWVNDRGGTYRFDIKIEGRIMYLFIIRTAESTKLRDVSAEHDILVRERDKNISDDQMKIRNNEGKVRKNIDKFKDNI